MNFFIKSLLVFGLCLISTGQEPTGIDLAELDNKIVDQKTPKLYKSSIIYKRALKFKKCLGINDFWVAWNLYFGLTSSSKFLKKRCFSGKPFPRRAYATIAILTIPIAMALNLSEKISFKFMNRIEIYKLYDLVDFLIPENESKIKNPISDEKLEKNSEKTKSDFRLTLRLALTIAIFLIISRLYSNNIQFLNRYLIFKPLGSLADYCKAHPNILKILALDLS